MDEPVVYRCYNCGACCGKLLIERQGVTKGLPLIPPETRLFEPRLVKPCFGVGEPGSRGFKVIGYQMTRNACPHHRLGGCVVWAYRPAICRSYPFVPVISQGLRVVKTLDLTCTALKPLADRFEGRSVPLDDASLATEHEAYELVADITRTLLERLGDAWFYDLKTLRWVPFREMLPGAPRKGDGS